MPCLPGAVHDFAANALLRKTTIFFMTIKYHHRLFDALFVYAHVAVGEHGNRRRLAVRVHGWPGATVHVPQAGGGRNVTEIPPNVPVR